MKKTSWMRWVGTGVSICLLAYLAGCMTTDAQKGGLAGAGIGALAGQIIGRTTASTLIGTGVGLGLGYIIGNEMDKNKVQQVNTSTPPASYSHNEVAPLGGSKWLVSSISPSGKVPPFRQKTVEFKSNGVMVTTTTNPDDTVNVDNEHYRVVGNTLIMNGPGYMINASYNLAGELLAVDAEGVNYRLKRI